MRKVLRIAARVLYWVLPPAALYVVLKRVDVAQLRQLVANANSAPILVGLGLIVLVVLMGAMRWHFLLRRCGCTSLPVTTSIREYCRSLALGLFIPGGLGSDAYRVMVSGRDMGYYRGAIVVGVEKVAALFSCMALITGLYPFLGAYILHAFQYLQSP
jgi:hypothetical protein